jgi:hypothetical protein
MQDSSSKQVFVSPTPPSSRVSTGSLVEITLNEAEWYSTEELQETVTAMTEIRDVFRSLGWIVETQTPELHLIEKKTENANALVKSTAETLAKVEELTSSNKSLKMAIFATTIATGALIGGPVGLMIAAKTSLVLTGVGIGAGAGAGVGWGLTSLVQRWI